MLGVLRPGVTRVGCAGRPTHRYCVGTQCWQGPCWLQLLRECRVWTRHPPRSEGTPTEHYHLGHLPPHAVLVIHHPGCAQFSSSCFLQAVADHIPQLVQGSEGAKLKQKTWSAQLALIISSQNFLQVLQQHSACSSPRTTTHPTPHWAAGSLYPLGEDFTDSRARAKCS